MASPHSSSWPRALRKGVAVIVGALWLAAATNVAGAQQTLRLWHGDPAQVTLGAHVLPSPYQGGAEKFKEIVEAETDGRFKVEIFSAGQLYNGEREAFEAMQIGVLDLAVSATAVISGWEPTIGVLDLPFMFSDIDVARRALDGPIGDELKENVERHGVKILAFADNGFRQLQTRAKAVVKVGDLESMKIRVMESRVFVEMFNALGANPTPMPFSEVYTGLQTGVLDGYEHPIFPYIINRVYEVAPFVTWTNHTLTSVGYNASMILWSGLTDADKEIFTRAAIAARDAHREYVAEIEEVAVDILLENGVVFTDVDTSAFKEKMAPVYASFEDVVGKDLLEKAINAK